VARRFLIDLPLAAGLELTIDGDLFRHIARVLRLRAGDRVVLCDQSGRDFPATITALGHHSLGVSVGAPLAPLHNCSPAITLIQGLPKGDKFDLILQKSTELGVSSIIAFPALRSLVRFDRETAKKRLERWQKIAREAARQSARQSVPTITLVKDLAAALRETHQPVRLFLWEEEREQRLGELLQATQPLAGIAFLVGPEGGFSDAEAKLALEAGFQAVTLGPRILRTETASLALLAILQYQFGDMG
jgi:16S rRNA (uracil1498-N3)-methyltransferase